MLKIGTQDYLCEIEDEYIEAVWIELDCQHPSLLSDETQQLFQAIANIDDVPSSFDTAIDVLSTLIHYFDSL